MTSDVAQPQEPAHLLTLRIWKLIGPGRSGFPELEDGWERLETSAFLIKAFVKSLRKSYVAELLLPDALVVIVIIIIVINNC